MRTGATIGVVSVIVISFILFFLIRTAFIDRTLNQLKSVNALKALQVDDYLINHGDSLTDELQVLLLENTGMGSTGESYIVGSDNRLRSASRFFPGRHPQTIEIGEDSTGRDNIWIDYRGTKVISFSTKLKSTHHHWRLVTEIDYNEVMEPVVEFRDYLIVFATLFALLVVIIFVEREIRLVRDKTAVLLEGQEHERKRITRELHDGVGQLLTAVRLRIDVMPFENGERKELVDMINETIGEVKRISYNVMPGSLVDFGLEAALKGLCDNTAKYSKLKFDFRYVRESDHKLNFDVTVAVYRIVQEGINNILKHAGATEVDLHIIDNKHEIYVLLKDNGKGFNKSGTNNTGLGLRSMTERAKLLRGSVDIHSEPGEGTTVEARIPF